MNNNKFYICRTHALLIYDSLADARRAREEAWETGLQADDVASGCGVSRLYEHDIPNEVNFWKIRLGGNVTFVSADAPILVIENIEEGLNLDRYCHVIAGEKFGWILIHKWLKFDKLESNDK